MALEVYWTQFAEDKLQDIFNYYKFKAGISVAEKITYTIVDETARLGTNPEIGTKEVLLSDRVQEFRYLITGNYKILYYINAKAKRVVIANVFDTRQNPTKMDDTIS